MAVDSADESPHSDSPSSAAAAQQPERAGSSGSPSVPSSSVLRLRGLPFSSTSEDVRVFFSPVCPLEEVYICRRDGRATGEAYVVCGTPAAAQQALAELNKQYIGSRYIELFEATEADLSAVKKVLEDTRFQGFVVRLRGLPYTATEADVLRFFEGVQLAPGDSAVVFAQAMDGRPTGEAYVELADEAALTLAMTRHKELMGTRYIEIFNSSKLDKMQAMQQAHFHVAAPARGRWGGGYGGLHAPGAMLQQRQHMQHMQHMASPMLQQQQQVLLAAPAAYGGGLAAQADQLAEQLGASSLAGVAPLAGGVDDGGLAAAGTHVGMPVPLRAGSGGSTPPGNSARLLSAVPAAAVPSRLQVAGDTRPGAQPHMMPGGPMVLGPDGMWGPGGYVPQGMVWPHMSAGGAPPHVMPAVVYDAGPACRPPGAAGQQQLAAWPQPDGSVQYGAPQMYWGGGSPAGDATGGPAGPVRLPGLQQ